MHLLRHGRRQVEYFDVVTRLRLILASDLAQQALTMRGMVVMRVAVLAAMLMRCRCFVAGLEMLDTRRDSERRMREEQRR